MSVDFAEVPLGELKAAGDPALGMVVFVPPAADPADMAAQIMSEKAALLPLPEGLFPSFQEARRRVHRDSYMEVANEALWDFLRP